MLEAIARFPWHIKYLHHAIEHTVSYLKARLFVVSDHAEASFVARPNLGRLIVEHDVRDFEDL